MDHYDLGTFSRPVTTATPAAQPWIDRGLVWLYGFNHSEAIACFREALTHDPACAMAHWGISYAAGPNYNLPWELYDPRGRANALAEAYDARIAAEQHAPGATPVEQAMIAALAARYPQREPSDEMAAWNRAYTDEIRAVFAAHPDDLCVRMVLVEAIMNETPWLMWDLDTGQPAEGAGTAEAMALLDEAFATEPRAWDHPGLLHLHVHLMEMSPHPERALRTADRLRTLVPDHGHLVHMPTHIDVLCGHYAEVLHWNQQAVRADRKFLTARGAKNVYTLYRVHNLHFAVYGAMFLGQLTPAMAAAEELIATTPEEMLRVKSPPMADFLEAFIPMKYHVMVRFGRWHDLIAEPEPTDPELYCATLAVLRYAKAVAFSALGRIAEAETAREAFAAAKAALDPGRLVHNNTMADLLEVAEVMLEGELAYRKGAYDAAFTHLREAVRREDALPYDEPWGWMQPTRHALGALLFEQGRQGEAEAVFRADLGLDGTLRRACVHPENVWALRGLHDCLAARGETVELPHVRQRLQIAEARAEVPVRAPCFCTQKAMAAE